MEIKKKNFDKKIPLERIKNKGITIANVLCGSCEYILTQNGSKVCASCGEIFCAICVEEYMSSNIIKYCLVCKQESSYMDCPKKLVNILGQLEIACRYSNCSAKVFYSDISEHEESCLHKIVICNFCKRELEKKDEETHTENCNETFMLCPKCGFKDRPEDFEHSCNIVKHFSATIMEMKQKLDKYEVILEEEKNKSINLSLLCDKLNKELIEVKSSSNIKSLNDKINNVIIRMNDSEKFQIKVSDLIENEKMKNNKIIINKCDELNEKNINKNNNSNFSNSSSKIEIENLSNNTISFTSNNLNFNPKTATNYIPIDTENNNPSNNLFALSKTSSKPLTNSNNPTNIFYNNPFSNFNIPTNIHSNNPFSKSNITTNIPYNNPFSNSNIPTNIPSNNSFFKNNINDEFEKSQFNADNIFGFQAVPNIKTLKEFFSTNTHLDQLKMLQEETLLLYDIFKSYVPLYCSKISDESKQFEFLSNMKLFLTNLANNEIKVDQLKQLIGFSNLYNTDSLNQYDLMKIYVKLLPNNPFQTSNWAFIIQSLIDLKN